MQVWELKEEYKKHNPNGHFFDRETLKFFGERESEMYVLKGKAKVNGRDCYILSTFQCNYPGGPRRAWHYFDAETFDTAYD